MLTTLNVQNSSDELAGVHDELRGALPRPYSNNILICRISFGNYLFAANRKSPMEHLYLKQFIATDEFQAMIEECCYYYAHIRPQTLPEFPFS